MLRRSSNSEAELVVAASLVLAQVLRSISSNMVASRLARLEASSLLICSSNSRCLFRCPHCRVD